jgi:endonuclease-3
VARLCPSYGIGETDPAKAATLLKFELAPSAASDPWPYAVGAGPL